MKAILLFIPLLFFSNRIFSCSCSKLKQISQQDFTNAKDIFIGKVIKVEQYNEVSRKITFQILEAIKTTSSNQIEIWTGNGDADCGLNISVGDQWYIFAYDNSGKSWAGLCGRSALMSAHHITNSIHKYYVQAVREYKKNKRRAAKEIKFEQKIIRSSTKNL